MGGLVMFLYGFVSYVIFFFTFLYAIGSSLRKSAPHLIGAASPVSSSVTVPAIIR
jgi:hypothetical protein